MTTSGTTIFNLQAYEILLEAWERCQFEVEALTAIKARSAARGMRLMLGSDWPGRGINLWKVQQQGPITTTLNATSFSTFLGVLDVLDMQVVRSSVATQMTPLGREDFNNIPNKGQTGRPSVYWVDRTLPFPIVHYWPAAENGTDQLFYWPMLQIQDLTTMQQTIDAPALFLEAIVAGTAARMAEKWVKDAQLRQELKATSQSRFETAFKQDTERAPLTIQPDAGGWGWDN